MAYIHILTGHVTSSIGLPEKLVSCLAASLTRAHKRRQNKIDSFWKAPVDNIESRISLVCHHRPSPAIYTEKEIFLV